MRSTIRLAVSMAVLTGCGGYDLPNPPGTPAMPAIAVAMSNAVTIRQGTSIQVPVAVSRLAGFSGGIDLSMEGLPVGITAGFIPATVPQSSTASTLTFTATGTAAQGPALVVLVGKAGAINAAMQVTLTVTP